MEETTCDSVGYDFLDKDEQYLAEDCSQVRKCTVEDAYSLDGTLTFGVKCSCKTQRCDFILHRFSTASLEELCEINVRF